MVKKHLKDYFIPHEGNDYSPHSLQKVALMGMAILVVLSFAVANLHSLIWMSSDWLISAILPSVIVELTNEEREDDALQSLRRNTTLDEAARLKAQHMAQNSYFSHYSPDGVTPWHWFGEVSYSFVHAGENLAIHFVDSQDVVDAWMESPTHRANIMSGNFTEIGVGTAEGTYEGFNTIYVVQLFGTPAAVAEVAAGSTPDETQLVAQVDEVNEDEVLAETVEITEQIQRIEDGPLLEDEETTTAPEIEETAVVALDADENRVSLYSDLISTSTGGVPASISPIEPYSSDVPYILETATQPHQLLQATYIALSSLVVLALVLSIFIEIRRQQPLQIAYGVAMLLLMYGLFELHLYISRGVLIV